jgi:hypothetical protein
MTNAELRFSTLSETFSRYGVNLERSTSDKICEKLERTENTGCPKSRFTKAVKCLTIIISLAFGFLYATGGNSEATLALVSTGRCVIAVFTQFAFVCTQSILSLERKYNLFKATFRTLCISAANK